jgi:hypothetical protein
MTRGGAGGDNRAKSKAHDPRHGWVDPRHHRAGRVGRGRDRALGTTRRRARIGKRSASVSWQRPDGLAGRDAWTPNPDAAAAIGRFVGIISLRPHQPVDHPGGQRLPASEPAGPSHCGAEPVGERHLPRLAYVPTCRHQPGTDRTDPATLRQLTVRIAKPARRAGGQRSGCRLAMVRCDVDAVKSIANGTGTRAPR